jgi:hypothetical protein
MMARECELGLTCFFSTMFCDQATISESTRVSGADNILTVLLAIELQQNGDSATEAKVGLPAGEITILGLYWPPNWPAIFDGPIRKIPIAGYRTSGFGLWDGTSLRLNISSRPQVPLQVHLIAVIPY